MQCTGVLAWGGEGTEIWYSMRISLKQTQWYLSEKVREGKKKKRWGKQFEVIWVTEDEMVGQHHQFNGHELWQTPGDGEGQGGLVCCSPWSHRESDTTWRLNNTCPPSPEQPRRRA